MGVHAQVPNAPYLGLWTRLEGFRAEELVRLLSSRGAVRATLLGSGVLAGLLVRRRLNRLDLVAVLKTRE